MEIWNDVIGYEGKYQVSNKGNIRSLNFHRSNKTKIMKGILDKDGYSRIMLYKDGKGTIYRVHRLVAEAFIPNPNGFPCVNHKDENPSNNDVTNLEWCTVLYNNNYGGKGDKLSKALKGLNTWSRGVPKSNDTRRKMALSHSKKVIQMTLEGNIIKEWGSMTEAANSLGCHQSKISECCRGNRKSHGGFRWKYKEE